MTTMTFARILPAVFAPDTVAGAVFYAVILLVVAALGARAIRVTIRRVLARPEHLLLDPTGIAFFGQLAQLAAYVFAFVIYAHLVPALSRLGTALLTGVSIISVVVGLAAQNTLGNLIAGLSILLYRPVRIGDRVQVAAPPGPVEGTIESLSLGYTIIRAADGRRVIVPNNTMASQVTIKLDDVASAHVVRAPSSPASTGVLTTPDAAAGRAAG